MRQPVNSLVIWLSILTISFSLLLAACGDSTPASLSVSAPTFTPATKSTALATTTPLPAPVPTATPQPKYPVSTQGSIVYEYQGDIWLISLPDGTRRQLTKDGVAKVNNSTINLNENPVWSPDNKQIAFASARDIFNQPGYNQGTEIYTMNPDGSNLKRITQGSASLDIERIPHAWLSTGEILIRQFNWSANKIKIDPLTLLDPATGNIKPLPIIDPNLTISKSLVTSPDKSSFAFVANKQVNYSAYLKTDIYISPISANTQPKALTDFPATFTINISQVGWSPDGTTLAFTDTGDTCLGYSVYTVSKAGGKSNVVYNEGNSRIPSSQSPLSYAPGGKWLTYGLANCLGNFKVVLLDTEKGGPPIELVDGNNPSYGRKIS